MKVDYVNPFVSAAFCVAGMALGGEPSKGNVAVTLSGDLTTQQCNVITAVGGSIEGRVVYGMSLHTADKIASDLLGSTIRTFGPVAAGALCELASAMTSNAMTMLAEKGYICHFSPPTVIRGAHVKIPGPEAHGLVIPICLAQGEMELTVCLHERRIA